MDRPRWNEILDTMQEDAYFCEDGETTIARDGAIAIPEVFYITDDGVKCKFHWKVVVEIEKKNAREFTARTGGHLSDGFRKSEYLKGGCIAMCIGNRFCVRLRFL